MKYRPLIIAFESMDDFMARSKKDLKEALKDRRPIGRKKNTLIWASVESYQQFMSDQKYTILAAIHKYEPQSVYQLAKMLNRAQQNVARDCDLLAGHGLIKFYESKDGRKTKAPRLIFNYNATEIHLPIVTYKIEFKDEAA